MTAPTPPGPSSAAPDAAKAAGIGAHLDQLYANRFPEADRERKARLWQTLCGAFFSRYVAEQDTVLDLGAGYCDFINNVVARRRIAVDLNPDTQRYAGPGVEVLPIDLEQLHTRLTPNSVDLAFASNVLEHLRGPDALLAVLQSLHKVLRPAGRLVILQPNIRHVGAGFWDFFDHTLPLTEKGMAEALGVAGFDVRESRSRFLPYTTKSLLPQWDWLVRTYLAVRPAQWLLGKQMLVVAQRRDR